MRLVVATVLALPALVLTGCGSKTTSTAPSSSSSAAGTSSSAAPGAGSLSSELPAAVKSKGTLTVAADASYAPNEFVDTDGKTVIGMDVDLADAIGAKLGLKVSVVNAGFDTIIPGLASGKYDMGASSFTDTKAREATVDFVTYFSAGTSFFGKAGTVSVKSLSDLCGHSVSVEKGTTQADDAAAQNTTCTGAGMKAVDVQVYDDQSGANLAISSGRADVSMADSPVAAYQVKQSAGAFALSGDSYGAAPYGFALPKGNGMTQPVLDAVKAIMSDGEYTAILTKYGVQAGAITAPVINGATS